MGLISKIKEGLSHNNEEHIAASNVAVGEAVVAAPAAEVVMEETVVDVPINTNAVEVDRTVIQAPAEEVQVKQAEAIVQEKKDIHQEIEVQFCFSR